jgi:hypothetical protein
MWRLVALARSDVSEERVASIFRILRISELVTSLAVSVGNLLVTANAVPNPPISILKMGAFFQS